MRKRLKKALGGTSLLLLCASAGYLALLIHPDPLFAHTLEGNAIVLHADEPIERGAARMLALAEAKVRSSPIFDDARSYHVYACQAPWRYRFFASYQSNSGGVAYAPIGRSVFLRRSRLGDNLMIGPSGRTITDGRTLDYYVAHEVTHTMTADYLGARASYALPIWVREGYADYVGRGETFDYDDARARLLRGDPLASPARSGHYLRYVLLVAHLLEREGWSVRRLLRSPPGEAETEARVRAAVTDRNED
jgi:hypothetical protein